LFARGPGCLGEEQADRRDPDAAHDIYRGEHRHPSGDHEQADGLTCDSGDPGCSAEAACGSPDESSKHPAAVEGESRQHVEHREQDVHAAEIAEATGHGPLRPTQELDGQQE
jgi:hypothetical protein